MVEPGAEKAYVKYAWVAMVVGGAIGIVIYAGQLLPPLPSISEQERLVEGLWIGFSLILVGATGFREGHRWTFFFALAFIVWAFVYVGYGGQEWFLVFTIVAVVLGFRKFFPRTRAMPTPQG
ncbi:MAG TPA: hypothetical protein VJP06_07325 [Thermoplasmata archaeon]|nr:hypothetical protein [Thermoplasmata archaeon]